MEYLDFELAIEKPERPGERYRARVRNAPRERGAQSWFDLPPEEELDEFRRGPANARSTPRHLAVDRGDPWRGTVKDFGLRLFEAVFAGRVGEAWRASLARAENGLLLRLGLDDDPRLLSIPWELLFDPVHREFVALERPVVRSLDLSVEPRPLRRPFCALAPLRVLVVLSCPEGVASLDTARELTALHEALGRRVALKLVQPKLDDVDRALRSSRWHVLHFIGHGGVDEEGGYLILEDRHGGARAVDFLRVKTFLANKSLRLVVLNACEGATPGPNDAFSGVAQALARTGIPAVVAMQQPVSDEAAVTFAKAFYGALAQRRPVAVALSKARGDLYRDHESEWMVPVLYLNGADERLLEPLWKCVAAIAAGMLLLGLMIWLLAREPAPYPPQPLPTFKIPRGAAENPRECPSPGDLNIAFEKIDAGKFEMGDKGSRDTRPVHQVEITQPYCLGAYEVTQELWSRVLGRPLPPEKERYLPVQGITHEEAHQFLDQLNRLDPSGHYRLPTEAEWEKAARAGQRMLYHFGDDDEALPLYGNCKGGKDGFADVVPVGQLEKNGEGLYDMYGNVFEWVSDWYGVYSAEPVKDPLGPPKGTKRVRRGGSWESGASACSSAARSAVEPDWQREENGLRIVREIR